MHFYKQKATCFLLNISCLKTEITKQYFLVCMRQQRNQCILSTFRYFIDWNGKVKHVNIQGPQISECKLCITWRDSSRLCGNNKKQIPAMIEIQTEGSKQRWPGHQKMPLGSSLLNMPSKSSSLLIRSSSTPSSAHWWSVSSSASHSA